MAILKSHLISNMAPGHYLTSICYTLSSLNILSLFDNMKSKGKSSIEMLQYSHEEYSGENYRSVALLMNITVTGARKENSLPTQ